MDSSVPSSIILEGAAPVLLEDVDCPLGCVREDQWILTGRDRQNGLPGEFNVVGCCNCGLLRTNPRPTSTSIGVYYPADYPPYIDTQFHRDNSTSALKRLLRPVARWVLDTKAQALPPVNVGRMLEVGCASGAFLHTMAEKGWDVAGIEFSESAAKAARELGYAVHCGPLESAPDDERKYDLVVAWMVLEHLHDPTLGLRKLADQSTPGAWLALSVPNSAALEFKIFRSRWYALQVPHHLYHFTPQTLAMVLEAGGWIIHSIHHQPSLDNLLSSFTYYFEDKGFPRVASTFQKLADARPFWKLFQVPIARIAGMLGQTGRMTVWARKLP